MIFLIVLWIFGFLSNYSQTCYKTSNQSCIYIRVYIFNLRIMCNFIGIFCLFLTPQLSLSFVRLLWPCKCFVIFLPQTSFKIVIKQSPSIEIRDVNRTSNLNKCTMGLCLVIFCEYLNCLCDSKDRINLFGAFQPDHICCQWTRDYKRKSVDQLFVAIWNWLHWNG